MKTDSLDEKTFWLDYTKERFVFVKDLKQTLKEFEKDILKADGATTSYLREMLIKHFGELAKDEGGKA